MAVAAPAGTPAPAAQSAPTPAARPARKRVPKAKKVEIPPILLEGDTTPAPAVSGPGQRYSLGPLPAPEPVVAHESESGELPESYGTGQLWLVARDPNWLYANWDLTRGQQRSYNRLSADGHLILRAFVDHAGGELAAEVHVHPESRSWFIHVGRAGLKYVAELGYTAKRGGWKSIAVSGATLTPPAGLSDDLTAEFATLPVDVPMAQLVATVRSLAAGSAPLLATIRQLRAEGHTGLPDVAAVGPAAWSWTPAQERALAEVISVDHVRRVWIGSLEITELVRRQLAQELASMAAAQVGAAASPVGGFGSVSSPFGGAAAKGKGFWFNVNAELIIYGATEPDATVTIGGRRVALRPDGSFSYRFALPDGDYPLPAVATSAEGDDRRWANLAFRRATEYGGGEVGEHPQDKTLKLPRPENV